MGSGKKLRVSAQQCLSHSVWWWLGYTDLEYCSEDQPRFVNIGSAGLVDSWGA